MAELKFWKMHGLGNDYVVFDNREKVLNETDYPRFAWKICKRRFSVGADGVISVCNPTSRKADFRMRIFNADGSEAEMCGNGIRCFAKYIYENNLTDHKTLYVETLSGLRKVEMEVEDSKVHSVSVDMGIPEFKREQIPALGTGTFINQKLPVNGKELIASCVSIGNPHCIIFIDDLKATPVEALGSKIENHPLFPKRINVEFVKVIDRQNIDVRTWERGCGETLACGTGACASALISNRLKKTDNNVTVHLTGGDLTVMINETITMRGPVSKVYEGILSEEEWS